MCEDENKNYRSIHEQNPAENKLLSTGSTVSHTQRCHTDTTLASITSGGVRSNFIVIKRQTQEPSI